MATVALGASVMGGVIPGGIAQLPNVTQGSVPVSFTVANPVGAGLEVDFTLQGVSQNYLTIGYWTALPALGFTINGVSVRAPQHLVYTPRQTLGRDLQGITITQGSTTLLWQYDLLTDADMATLMALFNPTSPQVTITYPNELGFWVQKTAYFNNFTLGERRTVLHYNVALTFTGILPD